MSTRNLLAAAVLAAALWSSDAAAAIPVALPLSESPATWEQALALGGFTVGTAQSGPQVSLANQGEYWLLRVRDANGKVQEVNVLPPVTQQDREDIVWLAMSLLKPAGGGSTWSDVPTQVSTPTPVPSPTPPPPKAPTKPAVTPPPATTATAAEVLGVLLPHGVGVHGDRHRRPVGDAHAPPDRRADARAA
ncbi:MAG: hypothetical protein ACOZNI_33860, partial [Myxococcota bacterium]